MCFSWSSFRKLGMATSTRNSGVIHSGIYYPKGSLKARHCVEGNRLSYEFCAKHNVPYRKTGKLVVAANASEEPELEALAQRGRDNGVEGLTIVGPKEIHAREPHIRGTAALDVPSDRNSVRRRSGPHARATCDRQRREHCDARKSCCAHADCRARCASIWRLATKMACKRNRSKRDAW